MRPARPIGHPKFVKHTLPELLRQRVFGIAMGYEDVNDHDSLRRDPMMALGVGKADPLGLDCPGIDRGRALAGKSTLNRLELANARTGPGPVRVAHRILADHAAIERLLVRLAVSRPAPGTEAVVLDFDATDSPLHGGQEGRFFHGYYDACCYLPLYCFIGPWPIWEQPRVRIPHRQKLDPRPPGHRQGTGQSERGEPPLHRDELAPGPRALEARAALPGVLTANCARGNAENRINALKRLGIKGRWLGQGYSGRGAWPMARHPVLQQALDNRTLSRPVFIIPWKVASAPGAAR